MTLTTEESGFLEQLEDTTLPTRAFNNEGHVHAAWLYLQQHPPGEAEERFIRALRRYAASLGAAEKYHDTLTRALLCLMRERIAAAPAGEDWGAFTRRNADLLTDSRALLDRHYSAERLDSAEARRRFLAPDRAPINSDS